MARYMDSAERAEENRSSAWILLILGGVGLIVIILGFFNIIPFPVTGFSKYMFCGVMGALCLIFLIAGIVSVQKTKTYTTAATIEKSQQEQIIEWCKENEIAKKIDFAISQEFPDLPEEEVYFKRYEGLKFFVFKEFNSMSVPFLDHVIDEIFDTLFEE